MVTPGVGPDLVDQPTRDPKHEPSLGTASAGLGQDVDQQTLHRCQP